MVLFTCQASRRKVDDQRDHIDRELKLDELLNVHINRAAPLCNSHDGGEIIVQNYNIGTLLGNLANINRAVGISRFVLLVSFNTTVKGVVIRKKHVCDSEFYEQLIKLSFRFDSVEVQK